MTELSLRPVPLAETRALRQAVLRPNQSFDELASHEPPDAFAVGAFDREELVAVGFIGPDGGPGSWRVRGMATEPRARSRGGGSAILEALIEHAMSHGATRVWCNARLPARAFYERAGFRAVSESFEITGIGPHYVMELIASRGCLESAQSAVR
jgi:GNAT superfamily N-acetyltransferase